MTIDWMSFLFGAATAFAIPALVSLLCLAWFSIRLWFSKPQLEGPWLEPRPRSRMDS